MLKQACIICKIVGIFAIIGCFNWGASEFAHVNLVARFMAPLHLARVTYALITVAGVGLLISFFTACPACKK